MTNTIKLLWRRRVVWKAVWAENIHGGQGSFYF